MDFLKPVYVRQKMMKVTFFSIKIFAACLSSPGAVSSGVRGQSTS